MSQYDQIQALVLQTLDKNGEINDSRKLGLTTPEAQTTLRAVLDSLLSKEMIVYKQITTTSFIPTEEGGLIVKNGSHEYRVWEVLPAQGGVAMGIPDLKKLVGEDVMKIGQGKALKNKWIVKTEAGFLRAAENPVDETAEQLRGINATGTAPDSVTKELQKRKLISPKKHIHYSISKGPQFALEVKQLETDLTVEMLSSGAWKDASFKNYNFAAAGQLPEGGALHPLLKMREEMRQIFFDMGFTEMSTSRFVESAFWNFDSMFVPQQHPAREVQDTFYVKNPPKAGRPDEEYYQRVAKVHESGGYGSIGYRAPFSRDDSERLLLRTHTTAVSTNMLYKIANQPGGFKPAKMFSIDRVFRNEAMDATHLAEFFQVEGVVADYDITLGNLVAFMEEFFAKMGNKKLKFKPAFNPYTEPSMEIFSYHEGLGKWIEIANSGIFRPEMLEPMGIPKNVRVLGWGMSCERPTMIKYGLNDIRALVGHKVDLGQVKTAAAVRLGEADRV